MGRLSKRFELNSCLTPPTPPHPASPEITRNVEKYSFFHNGGRALVIATQAFPYRF